MFKGDHIHMSGVLPLEIPNGECVEARISVNYDTTITITFLSQQLSNALMMEALKNQLLSMTLSYTAMVPRE